MPGILENAAVRADADVARNDFVLQYPSLSTAFDFKTMITNATESLRKESTQ
jgi:hypothetical protein